MRIRTARTRRTAHELACHGDRRREIESELALALNQPGLRMLAAPSKGGHDQIYFVESAGGRIGVLRANNADKINTDPVTPLDPGIPLDPVSRIENEWNAYSVLAPLGLAPAPIWKSHDAMLCEWRPGVRLSRYLVHNRKNVWTALDVALAAIRRMHDAGVVHMDLNLGNIIIDPGSMRVCFIDFEFGPSEWVTPEQQRAFDYLRLADNVLKPRRGGRRVRANAPRLTALLDAHVPAQIRACEVEPLLRHLALLRNDDPVRAALSSVFPRLAR